MAQVKITTDRFHRYVKKAKSLELTPYVYNASTKTYVLGDTTYDIYSIVGDTISIKHDSETSDKYTEFVNSPLIVNFSRGSISFEATCLDLQNVVIKSLFGAASAVDSHGNELALMLPDDMPELYCCIRVTFADERTPDIILPKVLMDNEIVFESLRTNISMCQLKGMAFATKVCIRDEYKITEESDGVQYMPYVPMFFMNKGVRFGVWHHTDQVTDDVYFTMYDDSSTIKNKYYLTASSSNNANGTVTGGGEYLIGYNATVTATAVLPHVISGWADSDVLGGEVRTIMMTEDKTLTALFSVTIAVDSEDEEKGASYIDDYNGVGYEETFIKEEIGGEQRIVKGEFPPSKSAKIVAVAEDGHTFTRWSDGNTENPRTIDITTDDKRYSSVFE